MAKMYKHSKYNIVLKKKGTNTVIFNSYSGGISEFDENTYVDLMTLNTKSPYFSEMLKQGFVVTSEIDETKRIIEHHYRYIYNSHPEKMQFTIATTLNCPLNCYYCFENKANKNMDIITAKKVIKMIIDSISNNSNCKQVHITWFGGEPLLSCSIIEEIGNELVAFCKSKRVEITAKMLTSGVLFDSCVFDKFVDNGFLTSVQYTLDGDENDFINSKRGTAKQYSNLIRAIKYSSERIDTYVRMNVTKENKTNLLSVVEQIIKDILPTSKIIFYAMPVVDYGNNIDNSCIIYSENEISSFRKELVNLLKRYDIYNYYVNRKPRVLAAFCGAMRLTNLTFGPEGEIYRCENLVGKKDQVIGDVDNGLYYNEANYVLPLKEINQKCLDCEYLPVCWEGCPAHKEIYKHEYDCEGFKNNFAEVMLNNI